MFSINDLKKGITGGAIIATSLAAEVNAQQMELGKVLSDGKLTFHLRSEPGTTTQWFGNGSWSQIFRIYNLSNGNLLTESSNNDEIIDPQNIISSISMNPDNISRKWVLDLSSQPDGDYIISTRQSDTNNVPYDLGVIISKNGSNIQVKHLFENSNISLPVEKWLNRPQNPTAVVNGANSNVSYTVPPIINQTSGEVSLDLSSDQTNSKVVLTNANNIANDFGPLTIDQTAGTISFPNVPLNIATNAIKISSQHIPNIPIVGINTPTTGGGETMVNRTSLDTNDFIHQNRNYSLYQNPVSSGEYVEIKNITDTANFNFNYAIINQSGQIIDMKMNHQGKITAPFTQGIYYVRFQNEEKEDIVKKLIVK